MYLAGDEAIPILREILYNSGEDSQFAAVYALTRIATKSAIELLTSLYPQASQTVRLSILRALQAFPLNADSKFLSVKLLAMALQSKDYYIHDTAHNCLCRLGWRDKDVETSEHTDAWRELPRKVLATRQLTVPEKIEVLELLHNAPEMVSLYSDL